MPTEDLPGFHSGPDPDIARIVSTSESSDSVTPAPKLREACDPRVDLARDRTRYAAFRTSLAMDRTTLSWVRTTLTMTSFGLGLIGFFRTAREKNENPSSIHLHHIAIQFGVALVIIGVVSTIAVILWHLRTVRQLRAGISPLPALWPLSILLAGLLAVLALAELWIFAR